MQPDVTHKVDIAKNEVVKIKADVAKLDIKTADQFDEASKVLVTIKKVGKNIEKQKDDIVKPLQLSVKNVRELFAPIEADLSEQEEVLRKGLLAYQEKQAKKAQKKAEKIEEAVDNGDMSLQDGMGKMSNIKQAPSTVNTGKGSVSFKTIRKVRIFDVGLLPARYLMNEKVVAALASAVRKDALEGITIPGVQVYEEKQTAVRT